MATATSERRWRAQINQRNSDEQPQRLTADTKRARRALSGPATCWVRACRRRSLLAPSQSQRRTLVGQSRREMGAFLHCSRRSKCWHEAASLESAITQTRNVFRGGGGGCCCCCDGAAPELVRAPTGRRRSAASSRLRNGGAEMAIRAFTLLPSLGSLPLPSLSPHPPPPHLTPPFACRQLSPRKRKSEKNAGKNKWSNLSSKKSS